MGIWRWRGEEDEGHGRHGSGDGGGEDKGGGAVVLVVVCDIVMNLGRRNLSAWMFGRMRMWSEDINCMCCVAKHFMPSVLINDGCML